MKRIGAIGKPPVSTAASFDVAPSAIEPIQFSFGGRRKPPRRLQRSFAFQLFDLIIGGVGFNIPTTAREIGELLRSAIVAAIWDRYLAVSKQVAETLALRA